MSWRRSTRRPGQAPARPPGPPPSTPAVGGPRRRVAALAVAAALALAGGYGFRQLFPAADLLVLLPVAAILPVLLVGVLSRRGRPASVLVTVPVWVAGFVAWTACTVAAEAGGTAARLDLVRTGVVDGWARILDVAVPAPADPDLLIVALAVTWFAAAVGAELTVRTSAALLPVLPAVAATVAATALSVPAPGDNVPAAGAVVALIAAYLLVRHAGGGPSSPRRDTARALLRGAVPTAAVVAAGVLAGSGLPAAGVGAPVDPRAYRATPSVDVEDLSPLSALGGWTAHPDEVLFSAEVAGPAAEPVTFRLAVLDAYDGSRWRSTARYVRAGDTIRLDEDTPDGVRAEPVDGRPGAVTQRIDIAGLRGVFLPSVGRPSSGPTSDGYAVDLAGATLLSARPLTPGSHYEITSEPTARPAPAELPGLSSGPTPADGRDPYLEVPPDPPPVLRQLAVVAAGRGATPFQRAALLRQYLGARFVFDPAVPPGHSFGHLDHFLRHTRRGTSEQFATAYVLAARLLGLPARLVVGFTAPAAQDGQPRTVRGADALAWAEVRFDGVGWLPFFPTPRAADAHGASVAGANQGESSEQTELIDAALRSAAETVTPPARAIDDPDPAGTLAAPGVWLRWVLRVSLAVGIAGACYIALAVTLPYVRRRRLRHAPRPRDRVVGAWRRALEALAEAGTPAPVSASPAEVARGAPTETGSAGDNAIRGLADLATLALFAPSTAVSWASDQGRRAADEAWRLVEALERDLRVNSTRRRRLLRLLAPGTVHAELRGLRDDGPASTASSPDRGERVASAV